MSFNKFHQLLIISLFIITGCKKNEKSFLRPDLPARYSITIGMEGIDRPLNDEKFREVCDLLTKQATANGIMCKSIANDPVKQQITFNIVGLMENVNDMDDKNYGINYYSRVLTNTAKLEFYDVYRNDEPAVKNLVIGIYEKYNLTGKLQINIVDPQFPGGYLSASPFHVAPGDLLLMDSILHLVPVAEMMPSDMALVWAADPVPYGEETIYQIFTLKMNPGSMPFLSGRDIIKLEPTIGGGNEPAVSLEFKPDAAKIWANKTREAAADNNREVIIVLDDRVLSAPKVMSEISGGEAQITGGFTIEENQALINRLQLGALPCTLKIVETKKL